MNFAQRWLVMITIATILFAIALLIYRINIRSLLTFFVIGIAAVTLWLYVDSNFLEPKRKNGANTKRSQPCNCLVCNHESAEMCFQSRCACCLIIKKDKVVGHSSDSLQ